MQRLVSSCKENEKIEGLREGEQQKVTETWLIDDLGPPAFAFVWEFKHGVGHLEVWNISPDSKPIFGLEIFTSDQEWHFKGTTAEEHIEGMFDRLAEATIGIRRLFVAFVGKLLDWAVKKLTPDQRRELGELLAKARYCLAPRKLGIDLKGRVLRVKWNSESSQFDEAKIWSKVFEIVTGGKK